MVACLEFNDFRSTGAWEPLSEERLYTLSRDRLSESGRMQEGITVLSAAEAAMTDGILTTEEFKDPGGPRAGRHGSQRQLVLV